MSHSNCKIRPFSRLGKNAKTLNLALQGGGAHGAFAWGILDKLLEDGRIEFEAISATSAGSMNAVVMAHGTSLGGYDGAREKLEEFWREISRAGELYSPVRNNVLEQWLGYTNYSESSTFQMFESMTRLFSPYQLNPFDFNPLRDVLEKVVDFNHLCQCKTALRLHISATNVRTGKPRIFQNEEMSVDAVLASACLPFLFKAVHIDGENYWDGGYLGNPPLYPLIYRSSCKDVLVIHLNPLERKDLPVTSSEIYNRMNEISFNSSLIQEVRAIAFVRKLIDEGKLSANDYKRLRLHAIKIDELMNELSVASKLNPDWDFLCSLRDAGRAAAVSWLDQNYEMIGEDSSIDMREEYL